MDSQQNNSTSGLPSRSVSPLFSLYKPAERALKAGAASFTQCLEEHRGELHPDFRQRKPNSAHQRANLLALTLMRMWTQPNEGEPCNFMLKYELEHQDTRVKLKETGLPALARPYHQCAPESMLRYFSKGEAQNLGSLTLLNLLMCSEWDDRSLGIVTSPASGKPWFTQRLTSFWIDYFWDDYNHPDLTRPLNWLDHGWREYTALGFKFNAHHVTWWNKAYVASNAQQLLLTELFRTALFIHLTPDELLEAVIKQALGEDERASGFAPYFFNKIRVFKKTFLEKLLPEDQQAWREFIKQEGSATLSGYLIHLHALNMQNLNLTQDGAIFKLVRLKGTQIGVPDLTDDLIPDFLMKCSLNEKEACSRLFRKEQPMAENVGSVISRVARPRAGRRYSYTEEEVSHVMRPAYASRAPSIFSAEKVTSSGAINEAADAPTPSKT
jgi:hypothetical protein